MKNTLANLPLWGKFIGIVGLPGAICFFLLWILFGTMSNVEANVNNVVMQLQFHERQRVEAVVQADKHAEEQTRVLYLICQNTARSAEMRALCVK